MKKSVLYYPYTSLPSISWVKQALLFNEKIGLIFPENVRRNQILDETTNDLFKLRVLDRLVPHRCLRRHFFRKFIEAVDEYLDENKMKGEDLNQNFTIYIGKMDYFLFEELQSRKLISRDRDEYFTCRINRLIGLAYITAVSNEIASLERFSHYSLFSDQEVESNSLVSMVGQEFDLYKVMSATLPVPKNASFQDIIKFREKNSTYLEKYIDRVKFEVSKVSKLESLDFPSLDYTIQKINDQGQDIFEQAYSYFGKDSINFESLSVIPIGFAFSTDGVSSMISGAIGTGLLIKKMVDCNRKVKSSDFYYLAHSKKKF